MGILEAARERPAPTSVAAQIARSIEWAPWRESAKVLLVTRVAFFVLAYAGTWMFATSTEGPPTTGFIETWERWDAVLFVNVAEHGYFGEESDTHSTAFFPLLPLATRVLMWIGFPPVIGAMMISALACLVAGAFLYKLAEREVGPESGRRALLYLMLFPTAVFLIAPYSEALFLAGAIPAFYYARQSRWLVSAPFAVIAMGARAAGVFLLLGLIAEFVRQRRFALDNLLNFVTSILVGALPLLGYGVFLALAAGDPFEFLADQKEGWGRGFVGLVSSFLTTWRTWEGVYLTNWMFAWRVEILAALIGLCVVIWALFRKEWGYAVYMGAGLAVMTTNTWYYSIPRMLLTWFPIMLFLASYTKRRSERHEFVLLAFAALASLGVLLFTHSIWFF